jgi:hypothetical protein
MKTNYCWVISQNAFVKVQMQTEVHISSVIRLRTSEPCQVRRHSHRDVARPQIVRGRDVFQVWEVTANILNKN